MCASIQIKSTSDAWWSSEYDSHKPVNCMCMRSLYNSYKCDAWTPSGRLCMDSVPEFHINLICWCVCMYSYSFVVLVKVWWLVNTPLITCKLYQWCSTIIKSISTYLVYWYSSLTATVLVEVRCIVNEYTSNMHQIAAHSILASSPGHSQLFNVARRFSAGSGLGYTWSNVILQLLRLSKSISTSMIVVCINSLTATVLVEVRWLVNTLQTCIK